MKSLPILSKDLTTSSSLNKIITKSIKKEVEGNKGQLLPTIINSAPTTNPLRKKLIVNLFNGLLFPGISIFLIKELKDIQCVPLETISIFLEVLLL